MSTAGAVHPDRAYIKRAAPHVYAAARRARGLEAVTTATPSRPGSSTSAASGSTSAEAAGTGRGESGVRAIIQDVAREREAGALRHARRLDGFAGDTAVVSQAVLARAAALLSAKSRAAIEFAHRRIRDFALAQRQSLRDTDVELSAGFRAGSKFVPVTCVGCYVPGGRYAHVASALMTVATAKAAGVTMVRVTTPANATILGQQCPHPAVLHALQVAGADQILCLGGVQGVAALGLGLFGGQPADIICGPGNAFVATAKRIFFNDFGVGMDLHAGPTESCIICDDTADPKRVAWDLISQAEHGPTSPTVLITTSRRVGERVVEVMHATIERCLPSPNKETAHEAWRTCGEVVLCADADAMVALSDEVASEHVQVMCLDPEWYHARLTNYGSLFLGAHTTVSMGDKASGPNHVLPTMRASRYTGGLSVLSFLKCLSWQAPTRAGAAGVAEVTAAIARLEGMEGHARAADLRATRNNTAALRAKM